MVQSYSLTPLSCSLEHWIPTRRFNILKRVPLHLVKVRIQWVFARRFGTQLASAALHDHCSCSETGISARGKVWGLGRPTSHSGSWDVVVSKASRWVKWSIDSAFKSSCINFIQFFCFTPTVPFHISQWLQISPICLLIAPCLPMVTRLAIRFQMPPFVAQWIAGWGSWLLALDYQSSWWYIGFKNSARNMLTSQTVRELQNYGHTIPKPLQGGTGVWFISVTATMVLEKHISRR